jgi:flagellar export protein FliJ
MKQFVFTLQSLYDMQENIEKQLKMQMAAIEAEMAQHLSEMKALDRSFDKVQIEYCHAMAGGVSAMRIKNYGCFFERLRALILLQQGKISQLEAEKGKCLQKLVRVRKEKMLLDKVREEQYREYLCDMKKRQAKMIDDFVSYKTTVS